MFTAHSLRSFKTPSTQRMFSFSKPSKASLHVVCFSECFCINRIDDSMGTGHGWISSYPARRARVYFLSPSQRKEITKNSLCVLCVSSEAPQGRDKRAVNI